MAKRQTKKAQTKTQTQAKAEADSSESAAAQTATDDSVNTQATATVQDPSVAVVAKASNEVVFMSPHLNYRIRGLQFENYRFVTSDPTQIDMLRASPAIGTQFSEVQAA